MFRKTIKYSNDQNSDKLNIFQKYFCSVYQNVFCFFQKAFNEIASESKNSSVKPLKEFLFLNIKTFFMR